MPYDEAEIDHICNTCGKVVSGPHAGETATVGPKGVEPTYKGSPVSHTECTSCQMASDNEKQMTAKYGKDWRTKGQQRKVQIDAEEAAKVHPWWRKL